MEDRLGHSQEGVERFRDRSFGRNQEHYVRTFPILKHFENSGFNDIRVLGAVLYCEMVCN
jgi:hypothetical protein